MPPKPPIRTTPLVASRKRLDTAEYVNSNRRPCWEIEFVPMNFNIGHIGRAINAALIEIQYTAHIEIEDTGDIHLRKLDARVKFTLGQEIAICEIEKIPFPLAKEVNRSYVFGEFTEENINEFHTLISDVSVQNNFSETQLQKLKKITFENHHQISFSIEEITLLQKFLEQNNKKKLSAKLLKPLTLDQLKFKHGTATPDHLSKIYEVAFATSRPVITHLHDEAKLIKLHFMTNLACEGSIKLPPDTRIDFKKLISDKIEEIRKKSATEACLSKGDKKRISQTIKKIQEQIVLTDETLELIRNYIESLTTIDTIKNQTKKNEKIQKINEKQNELLSTQSVILGLMQELDNFLNTLDIKFKNEKDKPTKGLINHYKKNLNDSKRMINNLLTALNKQKERLNLITPENTHELNAQIQVGEQKTNPQSPDSNSAAVHSSATEAEPVLDWSALNQEFESNFIDNDQEEEEEEDMFDFDPLAMPTHLLGLISNKSAQDSELLSDKSAQDNETVLMTNTATVSPPAASLADPTKLHIQEIIEKIIPDIRERNRVQTVQARYEYFFRMQENADFNYFEALIDSENKQIILDAIRCMGEGVKGWQLRHFNFRNIRTIFSLLEKRALQMIIGHGLLKIKNYPVALSFFQNMNRHFPNDGQILFAIAFCYEKMDRFRNAVFIYKKIKNPNNAVAEQIMACWFRNKWFLQALVTCENLYNNPPAQILSAVALCWQKSHQSNITLAIFKNIFNDTEVDKETKDNIALLIIPCMIEIIMYKLKYRLEQKAIISFVDIQTATVSFRDYPDIRIFIDKDQQNLPANPLVYRVNIQEYIGKSAGEIHKKIHEKIPEILRFIRMPRMSRGRPGSHATFQFQQLTSESRQIEPAQAGTAPAINIGPRLEIL